ARCYAGAFVSTGRYQVRESWRKCPRLFPYCDVDSALGRAYSGPSPLRTLLRTLISIGVGVSASSKAIRSSVASTAACVSRTALNIKLLAPRHLLPAPQPLNPLPRRAPRPPSRIRRRRASSPARRTRLARQLSLPGRTLLQKIAHAVPNRSLTLGQNNLVRTTLFRRHHRNAPAHSR